MKVIFLDVDGVLNSDEYIASVRGKNINGIEKTVDINKVFLLKQAVDKTGAKIVITSSIRHSPLGRELKELLLRQGMMVDKTPFLMEQRGEEIKMWLQENRNVEDFVILDNEIFESYDQKLLQKLVKVSNGDGLHLGEGLKTENIYEVINRLGERELDREIER